MRGTNSGNIMSLYYLYNSVPLTNAPGLTRIFSFPGRRGAVLGQEQGSATSGHLQGARQEAEKVFPALQLQVLQPGRRGLRLGRRLKLVSKLLKTFLARI